MEGIKDTNLILVRISGMVLVTIALIQLPKFLGAVVTLLFWLIFASGNDSSSDYGAMISTLNQGFTSTAIGQVVSFVVLVWLARWMFGYPKVMRRAFQRCESVDSSETCRQDES